jgi:hypothetical protein
VLGKGDTFPLALPEGTLEFSERTMSESMRLAMGESSPVKSSCSLTNSTRTPLRSGPAGEHVSHRGCVGRSILCTTTVSPSRANRSSSASCGLVVSAGSLVCENPVKNQAFELAFLVLVQRAHPRVSDLLPAHGASNPRPVRLGSRFVPEESQGLPIGSSGWMLPTWAQLLGSLVLDPTSFP